jgi:fatty-acid desaturase
MVFDLVWIWVGLTALWVVNSIGHRIAREKQPHTTDPAV